jgi:hypothetical protein
MIHKAGLINDKAVFDCFYWPFICYLVGGDWI